MFEEFQQAYQKDEQRKKAKYVVQIVTVVLFSMIILLMV